MFDQNKSNETTTMASKNNESSSSVDDMIFKRHDDDGDNNIIYPIIRNEEIAVVDVGYDKTGTRSNVTTTVVVVDDDDVDDRNDVIEMTNELLKIVSKKREMMMIRDDDGDEMNNVDDDENNGRRDDDFDGYNQECIIVDDDDDDNLVLVVDEKENENDGVTSNSSKGINTTTSEVLQDDDNAAPQHDDNDKMTTILKNDYIINDHHADDDFTIHKDDDDDDDIIEGQIMKADADDSCNNYNNDYSLENIINNEEPVSSFSNDNSNDSRHYLTTINENNNRHENNNNNDNDNAETQLLLLQHDHDESMNRIITDSTRCSSFRENLESGNSKNALVVVDNNNDYEENNAVVTKQQQQLTKTSNNVIVVEKNINNNYESSSNGALIATTHNIVVDSPRTCLVGSSKMNEDNNDCISSSSSLVVVKKAEPQRSQNVSFSQNVLSLSPHSSSNNAVKESFIINSLNVYNTPQQQQHRKSDYNDGYNFDYTRDETTTTSETCSNLAITANQDKDETDVVREKCCHLVTANNNDDDDDDEETTIVVQQHSAFDETSTIGGVIVVTKTFDYNTSNTMTTTTSSSSSKRTTSDEMAYPPPPPPPTPHEDYNEYAPFDEMINDELQMKMTSTLIALSPPPQYSGNHYDTNDDCCSLVVRKKDDVFITNPSSSSSHDITETGITPYHNNNNNNPPPQYSDNNYKSNDDCSRLVRKKGDVSTTNPSSSSSRDIDTGIITLYHNNNELISCPSKNNKLSTTTTTMKDKTTTTMKDKTTTNKGRSIPLGNDNYDEPHVTTPRHYPLCRWYLLCFILLILSVTIGSILYITLTPKVVTPSSEEISNDDEEEEQEEIPMISSLMPTTIQPMTALPSSSPVPSYTPSSSPTSIVLIPIGSPLYGSQIKSSSDDEMTFFGFSMALSRHAEHLSIGAPYRNAPKEDGEEFLYRAGYAVTYERRHDGDENDKNIFERTETISLMEDNVSSNSSPSTTTKTAPPMTISQASQFWSSSNIEWSPMSQGIYGTNENDWVGWVVPISPDGDWYAVCGGFMTSNPYIKVYEEDEDEEKSAASSKTNKKTTGTAEMEQPGWIMRGDIIQGPSAGFGLSISLSTDGKRLAVGSRGYARVYQFVEVANRWVPVGGDIEESMVAIVSLSGDGQFVAIGCYSDDSMYTNGGRLRVFRLVIAENELKQVGESYYGNGPEDGFGYAVSLSFSGNIIAVGTYGSNYVKVGMYDESSQAWIPMGEDIVGSSLDGEFGAHLALSDSGRHLVVGSSKYDNDAGRAVVYRYTEDGAWNEIGDVVGDPNDREGYSVAISPDGEFVATGAPYGDDESLDAVDCGRVRVLKIMSFD